MVAAEHQNKPNRFDNKKPHYNRTQVGVLVVALLCGIGAVGGIAGTSAFLTDKAEIEKSANVGTMNMTVTDMSDLDGDYGTHKTDGSTAGAITTPGYQGGEFQLPTATDAAKPSTGIINPGDDGIFAYKIENTGEKSFDTAKVVTVTVTLKDSSAKVDAAADKDAYTIEGLGTPGVSATGNVLTLTYATTDSEILSGSVEKDGNGTSAVYAYNTAFSRAVKNKFQNADIKINTAVYAKQHRNFIASNLKVADDGHTVTGTGDWTNIKTFETVIDVIEIDEDNNAD